MPSVTAHLVAVPIPHSGGGDPFQMRPRAALPLLLSSPLVRRCETGTGFVKGVVKAAASKGALKSPDKGARPSRFAPGSPLPSAGRKASAARERASSGIHPQGSRKRRAVGCGTLMRRWDPNGLTCL